MSSSGDFGREVLALVDLSGELGLGKTVVVHGCTLSKTREYIPATRFDQGYPLDDSHGPWYAVISIGGQVIYEDRWWKMDGPWQEKLPPLVRQEADRLSNIKAAQDQARAAQERLASAKAAQERVAKEAAARELAAAAWGQAEQPQPEPEPDPEAYK